MTKGFPAADDVCVTNLKDFVQRTKPTRQDNSGIDAIRGLFGSRVAIFVGILKDRKWVKHGGAPSDVRANR
jgi:hypothetical protein